MSVQYSEAKEIERAYEWLREYYKKPIHSEYRSVTSLEAAVSLLEEYGSEARILAGGIDLMGLMKGRISSPGILVNIKPVRRIGHISTNPAGLAIGALTRVKDLEKSPLIGRQYSLLVEAARSVASPHIRNMATIGGNLCQETRCWYFRRPPDTGITFNCRRKLGEGVCYALNGENEFHAVTGPSPCVSACPSDLATVLLAMDAGIKTFDGTGGRQIPIDQFYTNFGTVLKPAEIITSIQVPRMEAGAKQTFLKFRRRKTIDFAVVSVAAVIQLDDRRVVKDARIALGGVSYKPIRALEAERLLMDHRIDGELVQEASKAATRGLIPLSKNGHKIRTMEVLVRRAILA